MCDEFELADVRKAADDVENFLEDPLAVLRDDVDSNAAGEERAADETPGSHEITGDSHRERHEGHLEALVAAVNAIDLEVLVEDLGCDEGKSVGFETGNRAEHLARDGGESSRHDATELRYDLAEEAWCVSVWSLQKEE